AVQKAKEDPAHNFAVLFLDFDRFKLVNDSLGHDAGDRLLKGIAGRLQASLELVSASRTGTDALAARLGGDGVFMLMGKIQDPHQGTTFADGLRRLLATPHNIEGREVHSTASIGITTSELRYTRAEDALRDADTAMYHAKATGKARYVVFDRQMHAE